MKNIKEFDKFLNERLSQEKKLEIVQKLEEIELFVYVNPKPKPSDIRKLCNELVDLCVK